MGFYRKKPVVVEADIYCRGMEDGFAVIHDGELFGDGMDRVARAMDDKGEPEYTSENFSYERLLEVALGDPEYLDALRPYINTLEGRHFISEGDFIITGIKGERYPCKPDIFEKTYEPA